MPKNFSDFAPLQTERLYIRAPRIGDREAIFYMRSAPEVNAYIRRVPPTSLQQIDLFIKDRLHDRQVGTSIYWVLTLKEHQDQYIGAISLWNFSKDRKTAEVGYDLHPDYQGKGYMSEAITAVMNFGYNLLQIDTILAYTHIENLPSKRLLEQHGFMLTDMKDVGLPHNIVYKKEAP